MFKTGFEGIGLKSLRENSSPRHGGRVPEGRDTLEPGTGVPGKKHRSEPSPPQGDGTKRRAKEKLSTLV
jgi:hypothetical protein